MRKYIITESKYEKLWYYTHDVYDSWSTMLSLCAKFDSIDDAIKVADNLASDVEILQVNILPKRQ